MKFVDPKVDSAFKLLFGVPNNKKLIQSFLNAVLKLPNGKLISEIKFITSELVSPMPEFDGNKVFIDIHCTDQRDFNYIIEMQVENQHNFVPRITYYTARALWLQKVKKGDYQTLLPVIGIGIVNYKLLNNQENTFGNPVSKYVFKHETDNTLLPHSLFDLHFVELPKFKKMLDELETDLDRWLYFFKKADDLTFIPDQLTSLKDAFTVLNEATWNAEQLAQYHKEEDSIGIIQRVEQGTRKEAIKEEKEITAIKLLNKNMPLAEIADVTNLSIEAITELAKNLNNNNNG